MLNDYCNLIVIMVILMFCVQHEFWTETEMWLSCKNVFLLISDTSLSLFTLLINIPEVLKCEREKARERILSRRRLNTDQGMIEKRKREVSIEERRSVERSQVNKLVCKLYLRHCKTASYYLTSFLFSISIVMLYTTNISRLNSFKRTQKVTLYM